MVNLEDLSVVEKADGSWKTTTVQDLVVQCLELVLHKMVC